MGDRIFPRDTCKYTNRLYSCSNALQLKLLVFRYGTTTILHVVSLTTGGTTIGGAKLVVGEKEQKGKSESKSWNY